MAQISQPTAKLFMHGRSQAVRLPKAFRFVGSEVFVRHQGDEVVLSSRPRASIQSLIDALDEFEPGFEIVREQPATGSHRSAMSPRISTVATRRGTNGASAPRGNRQGRAARG